MHRTNETVGAMGLASMLVRPGDCSVAMGLGDLPVAAVSHYLNLIESSAVAAIAEFLDIGETTRLVKVELGSIEAAGIGAELRASATCTELVGRELTFVCEIYDGDRLVCQAIMKRAVVERVSFLARTAAQSIIGQTPLEREPF